MAQLHIGDASHLSHAYIIASPSFDERTKAARQLAGIAVCSSPMGAPCGVCRDCRKVRDDIHPDVITVRRNTDSSGRPKREINVDKVREISVDACILPNEAERKVYIIEDADCMNIQAQNAALKLLEEPPKGVIFILCVENVQLMLATVRSRCVEINLAGEADEENDDARRMAAEFIKLVAQKNETGLFKWCIANSIDIDVRTAESFINASIAMTADMITSVQDSRGLSMKELMELSELLGRCGDYLKVNTGVRHIFGLLAVDAISGNRGE